jgi:hypothetical protein
MYLKEIVPAEMDRVFVQCMEMVRLGTRSVAQLALDGTRSYQFATMAFVRLCAGSRTYEGDSD